MTESTLSPAGVKVRRNDHGAARYSHKVSKRNICAGLPMSRRAPTIASGHRLVAINVHERCWLPHDLVPGKKIVAVQHESCWLTTASNADGDGLRCRDRSVAGSHKTPHMQREPRYCGHTPHQLRSGTFGIFHRTRRNYAHQNRLPARKIWTCLDPFLSTAGRLLVARRRTCRKCLVVRCLGCLGRLSTSDWMSPA